MAFEPGGPEVVLRPDPAYVRGLKGRAWIILPLAIVWVVTTVIGGWRGGLGFGALALVAVVSAGGALLYVRTTSVHLTATEIRRTGRLVPEVTVPLDGTARGLLAPFTQPLTPTDFLLVITSGGRRLRLRGPVWAPTDLALIAAADGVEISDRVHNGRDFESAVPGSMPWRERRPWLASWTYAGVILVVVVVVVVLVKR